MEKKWEQTKIVKTKIGRKTIEGVSEKLKDILISTKCYIRDKKSMAVPWIVKTNL